MIISHSIRFNSTNLLLLQPSPKEMAEKKRAENLPLEFKLVSADEVPLTHAIEIQGKNSYIDVIKWVNSLEESRSVGEGHCRVTPLPC